MKTAGARALGLGGLALAATPGGAVPIELGGTASVNVGYAINPFLQPGEDGGALSIGGSISPMLTAREAKATTTLVGSYNRSEYLNGNFDPSDSFGLALDRQQTFSERLSGSFGLSYDNSRNSFASPEDIVDTTTLGARRKSYAADASLQWQMTQRDLLSFSASASKADYGNATLGDYKSYSASAAYRRVISSRTNVGLSMSISKTDSAFSGDTTTKSPRVVLDHQFDEAWKFNGSLGILFQDTTFSRPPFPDFKSTNKSIGFDANLCRNHPRTTLCFTASRDTSASGLGGTRTATTASATYSYKLTEIDSINASLSAADTKAIDRTFAIPKERYYSADVGYHRQISRRIDGALGASYRRRELTGFGNVDGFNFTLSLIARLGRQR